MTETFNLELTPSGIKTTMAAVEASRAEMFNISYKNLTVIPGFNVRADTAENRAHIAALAQDMFDNGYDRTKPMSGYAGKDGKDDAVFLTDGHCRLAAIRLAVAGGAEIDKVPVILQPPGRSMEDLIAGLVRSNTGKRLTPLETAEVGKRLLAMPDATEISAAKRMGITRPYLSSLMVLAGAPAKIRKMVEKGQLSATEAVKQIKEKGADAVAALEKAIETVEAQGKTKVTAGAVEKADRAPPAEKAPPSGLKISFRKGQTVDMESIAAVKLLAGGDWWELNDIPGKATIVTNIKFDIRVRKSPIADDATDPAEGL